MPKAWSVGEAEDKDERRARSARGSNRWKERRTYTSTRPRRESISQKETVRSASVPPRGGRCKRGGIIRVSRPARVCLSPQSSVSRQDSKRGGGRRSIDRSAGCPLGCPFATKSTRFPGLCWSLRAATVGGLRLLSSRCFAGAFGHRGCQCVSESNGFDW